MHPRVTKVFERIPRVSWVSMQDDRGVFAARSAERSSHSSWRTRSTLPAQPLATSAAADATKSTLVDRRRSTDDRRTVCKAQEHLLAVNTWAAVALAAVVVALVAVVGVRNPAASRTSSDRRRRLSNRCFAT